jgi:predicted transcriptional regulator
MTDADRFKVLFGPYPTPEVEAGRVLTCEARDSDVIVVGYSDARIPWPVGQRRGKGARALVVYGRLVDAVRHESNQAVAYWWGVTPQTVTKWRQALGVRRANEGTHRLHHDVALEPGVTAGREKAHSKLGDQARREKIATAKRGKSRPAHVTEALRAANVGRPLSEEARQKMSEAHLRRGTRPPAAGRPWTPEEDEMARTLPAPEVARRTGRTLTAVYNRRIDHGVPDGRRRGVAGS